jgi:hypothetical protein
MSDGPLVAAIVGKGRSGSSLIDTLLDQVPGITATGELWHRWGGKPLEAARCGCGALVGDCAMWAPALAEARAQTALQIGTPVAPETIFDWEREVHRWSRVPRLLATTMGEVERWPALHALRTFAGALYRVLAARTGASVVVDSSKWPATVTALGFVPELRLRVIQLVRDPRAVAYSWRRVQDLVPGDAAMPRFGAAFSSASWVVRNHVAARARVRAGADGMLLHYESLATDPRATLARLLALLGREAPIPVQDDGTARLEANHTVGGNPARFRTGSIRIRPDDEWRTDQRPLDRAVVTWLTRPWLARYGYRA